MGFFDRTMNRYYYGKSGKGDFKESDLPATRWQLFWEMLRIRFSALIRLNLMYVISWLPAIIVIYLLVVGFLTMMMNEEIATAEQVLALQQTLQSSLFTSLVLLVPCIAITGPFTAGVSYVTRNWARDEHAFIWSDFKDAVKANWKQSLVISTITGFVPLLVYLGWTFYGGLAETNRLMLLPQILILFIGLTWALSVTYMHPLIVTYDLKLKDVIRNAFILGLGKLPVSVAIRLLHSLPILLGAALMFLVNPTYVLLGLFLYYLLFGFSLSRFITASWTNSVFDKVINQHIAGARVNRGLREADPDEEDGEDDEDDEGNGDGQF